MERPLAGGNLGTGATSLARLLLGRCPLFPALDGRPPSPVIPGGGSVQRGHGVGLGALGETPLLPLDCSIKAGITIHKTGGRTQDPPNRPPRGSAWLILTG